MTYGWRSSVADADLADWVTVAAYLIAAWLSARAASEAVVRQEARDAFVWRTMIVLLVLLGINELLDLQTLLTDVGRAYAMDNGWYAERRSVQHTFIVALASGAALAGMVALWFIRRAHTAIRLAFVGLGSIALFVLLRAASFHKFDEFLGRGLPSFNWGSVQELVGIVIVGIAAVFYRRSQPRIRRRPRRRAA